MESKFYAVKKGRVVGIYRKWSECQKQIKDYPNAVYKAFSQISDAIDYLNWTQDEKVKYLESGSKQSAHQKAKQEELNKAVISIMEYAKKNKPTRPE